LLHVSIVPSFLNHALRQRALTPSIRIKLPELLEMWQASRSDLKIPPVPQRNRG
jgi:hypothetical protein